MVQSYNINKTVVLQIDLHFPLINIAQLHNRRRHPERHLTYSNVTQSRIFNDRNPKRMEAIIFSFRLTKTRAQ